MKRKEIPRHNAIGQKIREARKLRGLTLGELAGGICSLGKMSNIENGHRPVTQDELLKLSEKLKFPVSHFADPHIDEKIRELNYYKQKISDLIGLQQWKYIKSELDTFMKKIEEYEIPSRKIDYYFLSGIFYLKTNQNRMAEQFLTNVIQVEENSNYNMKLKLKSYNALSSILFTQKKVSKSLELLNKAVEISQTSPTILKEEIDIINFNRSILHLYLGSTFQSLNSINKVNHHIINTLETDYIKLLIRFLDYEFIHDIREDLLSLRQRLQEANDQEGILRGWALTIYTIILSHSYAISVDRLKELFLLDMKLISEIDSFKEKSLACYQLAIYVYLSKNEEQLFIQELIKKTKPLMSHFPDKLLIARNYYLEGRFHKQFSQNASSSLRLFEKALEVLDIDYAGLLKADILYEISQIQDSPSCAKQAIALYYGHLEKQFLFTHFHELILPTFKY
ncbi:helix-turn-helix domain-containing protein [Bacillus sp. T33-2]|uniref:helix-turn-helix domain-containing protein n=1 Tax=Bacillus sp. T33-2 TaxID=2054168 RepID=UPI000C75D5CF|nr:helix-turn-helix transcriptional regulator [Bacillus sp. T33-2]PLR99048.1 hypothetical protein CVD19_02990 [Bacillus sp. T33-2]